MEYDSRSRETSVFSDRIAFFFVKISDCLVINNGDILQNDVRNQRTILAASIITCVSQKR